MEQSVDIDHHLQAYRKDMLKNQTENSRYEMDEAYRNKINALRKQNDKKLEDHRQAISDNHCKQLDEERNLEHKR